MCLFDIFKFIYLKLSIVLISFGSPTLSLDISFGFFRHIFGIHFGHGFFGRHQTQNPNHKFIKLFYQIIQALHHYSILRKQADGGEPTRAFSRQIAFLNRFIKPAQATPVLRNKIQDLNSTWGTTVAQALCDHYRGCISGILGQLSAHSLSTFQINQFSKNGLEWAKRNFGKKLSRATTTEYFAIVRSLTNNARVEKPQQRAPPPSPKLPSPKPSSSRLFFSA